jgi:hypothetical protein
VTNQYAPTGQTIQAISARWDGHWEMIQALCSELPANERLMKAMSTFVVTEIEETFNGSNDPDILALILAGISESGTHDKARIKDAAMNLLKPNKKLILTRANTPLKRFSLLISPFLAVTSIYILNKDLEGYSWKPSLGFFLFSMAFSLSLAFALTGLGDWVTANHNQR